MSNKNRVTIYGCGGTGISLLKRLVRTDLSDFAEVYEGYVDGSRSNTNDATIDKDHWYFLEGVDGAGKIRKSNYNVTDRSISDILLRIKPSELNIIIFSGSGGSGSVIGPKIAEALFAQGKAVLFFVVGSTESGKATQNTLKTIYSLNDIGKKAGVASVMCFDDNENNSRNEEVNQVMLASLRATLDLYSGQHEGLDSADVLTWARPVIGAEIPAQLTLLDITNSREDAEDIEAPISVAELYGDDKPLNGTIKADYNTYGQRNTRGKDSLYYVIYTNGLDKLLAGLNEKLSEFESRRASRERMSKSTIPTSSDSEDDGMHL